MLASRSIMIFSFLIKIAEALMFELDAFMNIIGIPWQFANGVNSKVRFFSVGFQVNTAFIGTNPDGWQISPLPNTKLWGQKRSVKSLSYRG